MARDAGTIRIRSGWCEMHLSFISSLTLSQSGKGDFRPFPFSGAGPAAGGRACKDARKRGRSLYPCMFACLPLLVALFADSAFASTFASTIGRDTVFSFRPVSVLQANTAEMVPYVGIFNFFFTLELFFGIFACFLRLVIRVFRM